MPRWPAPSCCWNRAGPRAADLRAAAVGELAVQRRADGLLEMSFPNRAPEPVAEPPAALLQGLARAGSGAAQSPGMVRRLPRRAAGARWRPICRHRHAGTTGCGGDRARARAGFRLPLFLAGQWRRRGPGHRFHPCRARAVLGRAAGAQRTGGAAGIGAHGHPALPGRSGSCDGGRAGGVTSTAPSNSKTNSRAHCVRSVTCAMGVPVWLVG